MNAEIRNPQGERLDYAFHPASGGDSQRILVIGHGVTGTKDRPWAEALANAAAEAGIPALRFSFAGNGASEGDFRDCTITKEVADLGAVLDAVAGNFEEVIYAGHSMGGAVGVLRASSDPRIGKLISLAGMVHTKRFTEVEFGEETPDAGCMWEDEDCPLSSAYVNDLTTIGSVIGKAAEVKVPWLLVHGDEDDVVPIQESREIFAQANEPKKLVELPGANHVFANAGEEPMTKAVIEWLA